MNEYVDFVNAWLDAETVSTRTKYTERDMLKLAIGISKPKKMFKKGVETTYGRSFKMSDAFWESAEETLARHHRRPLYALVRHAGDIVVAYVGYQDSQMDGHLGQRYVIGRVDGEPKFVAWESRCSTCVAQGADAPSCSECQGRGWTPYRGSDRVALGDVIEVKRFDSSPPATTPSALQILGSLG